MRTTIGIIGLGLTGTLRMTWVQYDLAHVLEHSRTDETPGTWTGQACPNYELAPGADVDNATLRHLVGQGRIADLTWEAPTTSLPSTASCSRPLSPLIAPVTSGWLRTCGRSCRSCGPKA